MIRKLLCFQNSLRVVVIVIALLGIGRSALCQLPTATILGDVKDSSGAAMAGVTVTASSTETNESRTVTTGEDGSYRFPALPVGSYELRAEHTGFHAEVRTGLTLTVSQEAVVNIVMQLGSTEQTVSVTAEAPLVNTTSASLGGLVDETRVADLPLNGRNYADLVSLQTGVAKMVNTGTLTGEWFSSNGAPVRSNNYLLDGTPTQDPLGGPSAMIDGSTLGVDGIREFRVVTTGFSAEYGLVMGSQTVMVSKGGTNELHGDVFEYLRNSALDAANYFDTPATGGGHRLPEYERNNFGGALGGPIKKDKTFIFGVYEGLRLKTGVTTRSNVLGAGCHGPAGATITIAECPQLTAASVTIPSQVAPLLGLFPVPNIAGNLFTFPLSDPTTDNYGQIRVDQNFSDTDKFFVRYTITDSAQDLPVAYPDELNDTHGRSQYATLGEDHIFSPSLLNSARMYYSRWESYQNPHSEIIGPQYSFIPGRDIGALSIGGVTTFGPSFQDYILQNSFGWGDDVFYTRGRHSLKFGGNLYHYNWNFNLPNNIRGSISFPNITDFLQGAPITTLSALTPGSITARYYGNNILGSYVQDDIRVNSRLTVNLGLRYEFATQMRELHDHAAAFRNVLTDTATTIGIPFENNTKKDFSPRIGFAWDVRGDGKTAVRSGFGLFYDLPINLGNALNTTSQGTPPFSTMTTISSPSSFTIPFTLQTGGQVIAARTIDFYLKQPYMLEYNLTVEHQLPFGIAATASYTGSRGIHITSQTDENPDIPDILANNVYFWPSPSNGRFNPNWGSISLVTSHGDSYYNSLQVQVTKRLTRGLQFQSSYTWSKLIDNTQGGGNSDATNASDIPSNPLQSRFDRGVADFNIPQIWHFNAIYHLPQRTSGHEVLGKFLNGWWMSGIETLQSGPPFTVALNTNRSRSGVNSGGGGIDRPNLVPGRNNGNITRGVSTGCQGVSAGTPLGTPSLWYDPCAFTIPTAGYLGDSQRNMLMGPGFSDLDFSLVKDTSIGLLGEAGALEFRAEVFNILNHPNFSIPSRIVFAAQQNVEAPLSGAGSITSTGSFTSRQIQFALKLLF